MTWRRRLLVLALWLACGCDATHPPATDGSGSGDGSEDRVALPGDDEVLAVVAGTTITRFDVDRALDTVFDDGLADRAREEGEATDVLHSLVATRAMAMARERELSPLSRALVEREVEAFREELLARQYLAAHTTVPPPSEDQARRFYDANPERYGGGEASAYEMIVSDGVVPDARRASLASDLAEARDRTDWAAWIDELGDVGFGLSVTTGRTDGAPLHERLASAVAAMDVGDVSEPMFVQGRLFLVRVTGRHPREPVEFDEVREDILRLLSARQMGEAVRQARVQALDVVDVRFAEAP